MPRASKGGFYAVSKGRTTGVFLSWDECEPHVKGFVGARYKKFTNAAEAEAFAGLAVASPEKAPSTSTSVPINTTTSASPTKPARGRALSINIEDESGWDVVYCDGACKGNGKVGSVAGVGVWWGSNDPRNVVERCPGDQTNNRAELIAIVRILETTPITPKPLLIKTDSQYSINCFKEWLPKWRQNGFRSSSNLPVKNAPLIRYLSSLLDQRAQMGQKVRLQHVKGHNGEEGNEGADGLADRGCTLEPLQERDWGALEGKVRENMQNKPVSRIQDLEILEVAGQDNMAAPKLEGVVNQEDVDLQLYADALLSDEELRELAAKGFESDN